MATITWDSPIQDEDFNVAVQAMRELGSSASEQFFKDAFTSYRKLLPEDREELEFLAIIAELTNNPQLLNLIAEWVAVELSYYYAPSFPNEDCMPIVDNIIYNLATPNDAIDALVRSDNIEVLRELLNSDRVINRVTSSLLETIVYRLVMYYRPDAIDIVKLILTNPKTPIDAIKHVSSISEYKFYAEMRLGVVPISDLLADLASTTYPNGILARLGYRRLKGFRR